ncbi:CCA tRNA nucleotidyltransferase [Sphingomonas sp. PL-96]|uniref:CCA tRNA nucleotidyltransferase n=1 Tax=Sphingomonas sp. PL-96 TaxID=2887201 RepID=UPI001E654450|nr:CCA tRNA nucleotidyltransferase [Sphingomonas sp. PL-96]MCC2975281.1 CCA tRNA nucleotidyltransferase [Sphingomonas sp. PL-96]
MDALTLPTADWQARAGLSELARALGGDLGEARYVGGAVRDTLLGLPVADLDVATAHGPQSVLARLKEAGIRAVPTGLQHGTITAVLESGPVEVTTLRRDVATDGRHATVAFTDDWREDAARRDFTMNALYADMATGRVTDYFEGVADLRAGRVRFIGDPLRRIAEDHLRILRFFRFLARFGDTPDPEGLAACIARANDLMALSRERVSDELLKLLVARSAVEVVGLMQAQGIFVPVLPEIDAGGVARLGRLAARETACGIAPDAIRRLVALVPAEALEAVGARLKLSNMQRKRLALAAGTDGLGSPRALAYRIGTEGAVDRLLLSNAEDAAGAVADLLDWVRPQFPLTGGTLVARGVGKGPDVARLLRRIEDQWIAEGFPDAARVEALMQGELDQRLRSTSS